MNPEIRRREHAQWLVLADRAVQDADADWCKGLRPRLVGRAKQSRAGRRMLATQLAGKAAPKLLRSITPIPDEEMTRHFWLRWPIERLKAVVADLGALSLLPAIRETIDGATVTLLRTVLSEVRHAWVLGAPDPWCSKVPELVRNSARIAICSNLTSASKMQHLVYARGISELRISADNSHPAIYEKVRLFFSPDLRLNWQEPWLPAEIVREHLRACERDRVSQSTVSP